jgi:hypothetical protein
MQNDTLIKCEGLRVLAENLGLVEAERFVALLSREPFNYTEWQRSLYRDWSLRELYERVKQFETIAG